MAVYQLSTAIAEKRVSSTQDLITPESAASPSDVGSVDSAEPSGDIIEPSTSSQEKKEPVDIEKDSLVNE